MSSKGKQKKATSYTRFYSKYHKGRKCSDCALCGHAVSNVTHFETWDVAEKQFVLKHLGKELSSSSCICKAHHTEAKRYCSQNGYIPKWKKRTKSPGSIERVLVCTYPQCSKNNNDTRLIVPSFESQDNIKSALSITEDSSLELVLCPKHYTEVHKQLMYPPPPCASCGLKPKKGTRFIRYCPDTITINQILFENTGSSQRLQNTDKICSHCYKSHTAVLKSMGDVMVPNEQLESDIAKWEQELSQTADRLTKGILTTVVYVAKEILPQHAVLLPEASDVFIEAFRASSSPDLPGVSSSPDLHLDVEEGTIKLTSQWVLSQLLIYLHRYLDYKCIHKRFGTILLRKGGDALLSLSWAMGRQRLDIKEASCKPQKPCCQASSEEQILKEAGHMINDLLHKEINKTSEQVPTDDPSSFNIVLSLALTQNYGNSYKQPPVLLEIEVRTKFYLTIGKN